MAARTVAAEASTIAEIGALKLKVYGIKRQNQMAGKLLHFYNLINKKKTVLMRFLECLSRFFI